MKNVRSWPVFLILVLVFCGACVGEGMNHTHPLNDDDEADHTHCDDTGVDAFAADSGTTTDDEDANAGDALASDDGGGEDAGVGEDGSTSDCNLPDPPGDTIVNLGDEGLSPGDTIDGWLEDFVEDGVELHIPAGTYEWNGTFPPTLDNSSIIGDGEVIWDAGDGWGFSGNFTASGDGEIRNITVKGKCNGDGKFRAIAYDRDATLTLRNFWMPDGCYDELERSAFYIPSSHEGTLNLIDVRLERFPNNGLYASSADGPVHVIGGLYRNNNISNMRLGSSDSSAKEVVIIQDEPAPPNEFGQRNQRGLRIRKGGDDITIEDVSITQTVGGQPIQIHRKSGGSGTLHRVRIRNDESSTAIGVYAGDWSGSDIDLTGSGDLDIDGGSFDDVCRGSECDAPSTTPRPFCR